MQTSRGSVLAIALFLLPFSAVAAPGGPFQALCASLLSSAEDAEGGRTPEAAIADAWAELLLRDENEKFTDFLAALANSGSPSRFGIFALTPGEQAVDAPSLEAADQLRATIALLEEQGALDRDRLVDELLDRTRNFSRAKAEQRRIAEEQERERKGLPNPVRTVKTEGHLLYDLIRLSSGGFALAAGDKAFLLEEDGSNLRKVEFPGDSVQSLIESRDGSLVAVSQNALLYRFDTQGAPLGETMLAGRVIGSPVELRNGTIVVGNVHGALFFVDRDGNFVGNYGTDGTIASTPIQLSTNGNIVVASDDACVHFLDEAGNFLNKTCADYAFELSPIELSNGNVFAVNPRGKGYIFDPNGNVLREFERDWVVESPVQGPNGRIALATDAGKILFLDETGEPTGFSYEVGESVISRPTSLSGNRLAFADDAGRIHVIDWNGNELFRISRPERLRAPIRETADGRLVVAALTGEVLFIDLSVLSHLSR